MVAPRAPAAVLLCLFLVGSVLVPPAAAQPAAATGPAATTHPLPAPALDSLRALRSGRRFDEALSLLTRLQEDAPDHPGVLWRRALILTELGKVARDDDEALAYYRRALKDANEAVALDSTSAWSHTLKALAEGRLCLHVGRTERARRSEKVRDHARRALRLDSTQAAAHHLLGRWHRDVADLNFIQRTIVKAIYDDAPRASLTQAVRHFEQAIELESRSYHHLELAKTYRALDREAEARAELRRALGASGFPLDPEYKAEARSLLRELE